MKEIVALTFQSGQIINPKKINYYINFMRIAFVGKGGSGKSTLSTLFFLHLIKNKYQTAFIDADLNIHVPKLLGIEFDENKSISLNHNVSEIRKFLKGNSERIKSINEMYKTTPPSKGVNFFEITEDNFIIQNYFEKYENSFIGVVGTYDDEEIGRSCYHTNLSIFENLLSFSKLQDNQVLLADMVAGIDAFSNTLHMQFDVIFIIVEPTLDSVEVFDQYKKLAEYSGVYQNIFVVGNKIEDASDVEFLTNRIRNEKLVGYFKSNKLLRNYRRNGESFTLKTLDEMDTSILNQLLHISKHNIKDPNERLAHLYKLHQKYIAQDYVVNAVGDISGQIDQEFKY